MRHSTRHVRDQTRGAAVPGAAADKSVSGGLLTRSTHTMPTLAGRARSRPCSQEEEPICDSENDSHRAHERCDAAGESAVSDPFIVNGTWAARQPGADADACDRDDEARKYEEDRSDQHGSHRKNGQRLRAPPIGVKIGQARVTRQIRELSLSCS